MSIPMLFGNTVGIEKVCELFIVKKLKFEEKNNLFAKFPIGATMQDGGKRKEAMIYLLTDDYLYIITE